MKGIRLQAVPAPAPGQGQGAKSPDSFSARYQNLKNLASQNDSHGFDKTSLEYKFYAKQNWDRLKNEFFTTTEKNAAYTYPDAETFVAAKWKKAASQKAALMVIGRFPTTIVPWLGDWTFERFEEHWVHDKRVERLADALQQKASAGVISYSLASFYVEEMTKIKAWMDQLQMRTKGSLFPSLPSAMPKSKADRDKVMSEWRGQIKFVLGLQQKLLNLMDQARSSIQSSVGGQEAVLASLVSGVARDAVNSPLLASSPDRVKALVDRMAEVAVHRARLFDVKIPDEVIDVETTPGESKSRVQ